LAAVEDVIEHEHAAASHVLPRLHLPHDLAAEVVLP